MPALTVELRHGRQLSPRSVWIWRILQNIVWLAGCGLLFSLFFYPETGLMLFWNVLIPVAPLLFVLAVGVWRNVCPLATTNLLPRHFFTHKRKKLTAIQAGRFSLISVIALYLIVPLRHPLFNQNGPATGLLIVLMAGVGILLGTVYEWKSAWCSGLCPIHPVEKLYGNQVAFTVPNTHCRSCENCVVPCPDSTPNMSPTMAKQNRLHVISGWLITGGLPGFIWGWFQVSDNAQYSGVQSLISAYTYPVVGMIVSLSVFSISSRLVNKRGEKLLGRFFAAAGVSLYYWYRIPALIGYGEIAGDGLLFDITDTVPPIIVPIIRAVVTSFFAYWFLVRKAPMRSWTLRPKFSDINRQSAKGLSPVNIAQQ